MRLGHPIVEQGEAGARVDVTRCDGVPTPTVPLPVFLDAMSGDGHRCADVLFAHDVGWGGEVEGGYAVRNQFYRPRRAEETPPPPSASAIATSTGSVTTPPLDAPGPSGEAIQLSGASAPAIEEESTPLWPLAVVATVLIAGAGGVVAWTRR